MGMQFSMGKTDTAVSLLVIEGSRIELFVYSVQFKPLDFQMTEFYGIASDDLTHQATMAGFGIESILRALTASRDLAQEKRK